MVFILSAFWWIRIRIKDLWKLPDGTDWLRGKLGLVLIGGSMLSNSVFQLSVDGWGYVPSLLFDLRPNYGAGNEDNNDLHKVPGMHCGTQCPWPFCMPLSTHASTRGSSTCSGKSGLVSCGATPPFSWVLLGTRFCLCPPRVCLSSPE